jgi:hypothetical protein
LAGLISAETLDFLGIEIKLFHDDHADRLIVIGLIVEAQVLRITRRFNLRMMRLGIVVPCNPFRNV